MLAAVQEGNVKTLRIGEDLQLPIAAVTERLAFLGMSGGGKTYAAMKLAELMLEVGAQVVALDPVGPWWGLRASGKGVGFPIHVFGGIHGDMPLVHTAGALVADLVVEKGISAVLDVSDFTGGQMATFVSDFAERFFDRKKRTPTPVHLFLEEAHFFIPQVLPPGERGDKAGVMMGRVDRIARVGRNYGIGSSIISQQPQSVKKTALNQARTIFAFASGGKHERTAIIDWFGSNTRADNDAIFELLRHLENGVAYCASTWLKIEGRKVHIAAKQTFDSSKTPQFGEILPKPKTLAPVDVEAVKGAMAEVAAERERDDPRSLRKTIAEKDRRIAELERELAKKPAAAPPGPAKEKRVEVPVLKDGQLKRVEALLDRYGEVGGKLFEVGREIADALHKLSPEWSRAHSGLGFSAAPRPAALPPPARRPIAPASDLKSRGFPRATPARPPAEGEPDLRRGERRILEVLARSRPARRSRAQLGTLSGFTPSGGTFGTYWGVLRRYGLVDEGPDGLASITEAGLAAIGAAGDAPAQTREEIVETWRRALRAGERAMLDALLAAPNGLSRDDLGERTGFAASGGTFGTYLGVLRRNGLAEVEGVLVRAGEVLLG